MFLQIRIVVTHQLQFLKLADQILVIKEVRRIFTNYRYHFMNTIHILIQGKIAAHGSYEKLIKDGMNFISILKPDKKHSVSFGSENGLLIAV